LRHEDVRSSEAKTAPSEKAISVSNEVSARAIRIHLDAVLENRDLIKKY